MYLQMKLLEISWFPTRLIHLLESRHSLYPCHSSYITLVKSLFYPTRSTYVIILPKLLSRTLSSFTLLMNSSIYPSDSTQVTLLMSLYPSDSTHVILPKWLYSCDSTNEFMNPWTLLNSTQLIHHSPPTKLPTSSKHPNFPWNTLLALCLSQLQPSF